MTSDIFPRGFRQVYNQRIDHGTDHLANLSFGFYPGEIGDALASGLIMLGKHLHLEQLLNSDEPRTHTIINIMIVIGYLIGQISNLRLQRRLGFIQKALPYLTQTQSVASIAVL